MRILSPYHKAESTRPSLYNQRQRKVVIVAPLVGLSFIFFIVSLRPQKHRSTLCPMKEEVSYFSCGQV
jgi:hypothetical protein